MGKNIEELNFLNAELKKINSKIEKSRYDSPLAMASQGKLWELRDKIKKEIKELEGNYDLDK